MFEWEDKTWFPPILRRMQTDYIGWMVAQFAAYQPALPHFTEMVKATSAKNWVDLCSGNGGPAIWMYHQLKNEKVLAPDFKLQITDLYPGFPNNVPADVEQVTEPVNALQPDASITGVRTMFNAFHHFDDAAKIELMQKHGPSGFFVVEVLQPNPIVFIKILIATTVGQLLLTPFVKPFSWMRLLLTYIIPINIFTVCWDGLVSVLRVSSPAQLKSLLEKNVPEGCTFQTGLSGPFWAPITWFYIIPSTT
jgi:hypothetical protein